MVNTQNAPKEVSISVNFPPRLVPECKGATCSNHTGYWQHAVAPDIENTSFYPNLSTQTPKCSLDQRFPQTYRHLGKAWEQATSAPHSVKGSRLLRVCKQAINYSRLQSRDALASTLILERSTDPFCLVLYFTSRFQT